MGPQEWITKLYSNEVLLSLWFSFILYLTSYPSALGFLVLWYAVVHGVSYECLCFFGMCCDVLGLVRWLSGSKHLFPPTHNRTHSRRWELLKVVLWLQHTCFGIYVPTPLNTQWWWWWWYLDVLMPHFVNFYKFIFFKFYLKCMSVCLHVDPRATCTQCPQNPEEGVRSWHRFLWKSNKLS